MKECGKKIQKCMSIRVEKCGNRGHEKLYCVESWLSNMCNPEPVQGGLMKLRTMTLMILAVAVLPVLAADYGYAEVSQMIFHASQVVGKMMNVVCWVAGGVMLIGSMVKYKKYRENPVEVRFSSVMSMLVTSLAVIALGFVPMFAGT